MRKLLTLCFASLAAGSIWAQTPEFTQFLTLFPDAKAPYQLDFKQLSDAQAFIEKSKSVALTPEMRGLITLDDIMEETIYPIAKIKRHPESWALLFAKHSQNEEFEDWTFYLAGVSRLGKWAEYEEVALVYKAADADIQKSFKLDAQFNFTTVEKQTSLVDFFENQSAIISTRTSVSRLSELGNISLKETKVAGVTYEYSEDLRQKYADNGFTVQEWTDSKGMFFVTLKNGKTGFQWALYKLSAPNAAPQQLTTGNLGAGCQAHALGGELFEVHITDLDKDNVAEVVWLNEFVCKENGEELVQVNVNALIDGKLHTLKGNANFKTKQATLLNAQEFQTMPALQKHLKAGWTYYLRSHEIEAN